MSTNPNSPPLVQLHTNQRGSREVVVGQASNEFVFAVVGHAGSGTSFVANALKKLLEGTSFQGKHFDVSILKARKVIEEWAIARTMAFPAPGAPRSLNSVEMLQDLGDQIRAEQTEGGESDHAAVARALVELIARTRATRMNIEYKRGVKVEPDGTPRAYILDSIRHPAEVELLRQVYGQAFLLVGVVCEEEKRSTRLIKKYNCGPDDAKKFMERDANDEKRYGQHVADAFHQADFFVDNTADREKTNVSNPDWTVGDDLGRLLRVVMYQEVVRPTLSETAMYQAFSARMQSACLSRQVGAAIVDKSGNVLATGTNEAPKAGGGVYGESFDEDSEDARCAFFKDEVNRFCRNTVEQNSIIDELLTEIPEFKKLSNERREELKREIRKTRIGGLLEFSRAVHAEMDALLSAGRKGISVQGAMLFVTTYPCHYCARHIVAAGIEEVQYIEPYPKSRALDLHRDSIVIEAAERRDLNRRGIKKVLFHPFSGIAPRFYKRSFLEGRDLKVKNTGMMKIHQPEWTQPGHLPITSYVEIEARLAGTNKNDR